MHVLQKAHTAVVSIIVLFFIIFYSGLYIHAGPRLSIAGLPDMPDSGHYVAFDIQFGNNKNFN